MRFLLITLILFYPSLTYSAEVQVKGNKKTNQDTILSISKLNTNQTLSSKELQLAKQRLLRTGIFSDVSIIKEGDSITINVQERWTLIPIVKFSSGGGVSQLTAGVYEANFLGDISQLGAQYERLEDTNSGIFWYKTPHLYEDQYGLDLQFWEINRLRTKYDQAADNPTVSNGFLHTRSKLHLGVTKNLSDIIRPQLFYEFHGDRFSDRLVPEQALGTVKTKGLPPNSTLHFAGIGINYDDLKRDAVFAKGLALNAEFKYGLAEESEIKKFFKTDFDLRYYKMIRNITLAQRFKIGFTNTEVLQYWNYFGGLESIRGFADNRFAGRYYWLSNSEARVPLVKKPSWILEGVSFVDLIGVSEYFKDSVNLTAASVGLGSRIILPKIYRFVFRLDFAKPLKKDDNNEISFGVQQFF